MAQSAAIVDVLKQALKSYGLTYAAVAEGLQMSEASVKRMFASKHFTLARLDAICQLMNMEVTDLLQMYDESRLRISHLSNEQEAELVADIKLLLVAVCVRNHLGFDDITGIYQVSETECIQHLARLDKLGLIDLLPKNKIRLRIDEDFAWLPGGPIEQFFERNVQADFMQSGFTKQGQRRLFLTGLMSKHSRNIILRKIDELAIEFGSLYRSDMGLALEDKSNIGVLIAARPWELGIFKDLHR